MDWLLPIGIGIVGTVLSQVAQRVVTREFSFIARTRAAARADADLLAVLPEDVRSTPPGKALEARLVQHLANLDTALHQERTEGPRWRRFLAACLGGSSGRPPEDWWLTLLTVGGTAAVAVGTYRDVGDYTDGSGIALTVLLVVSLALLIIGVSLTALEAARATRPRRTESDDSPQSRRR